MLQILKAEMSIEFTSVYKELPVYFVRLQCGYILTQSRATSSGGSGAVREDPLIQSSKSYSDRMQHP